MTQIAIRPTVTGPITDGKRGWPFAASMLDLAAYGYVGEEFFLDGMADDLGLPSR